MNDGSKCAVINCPSFGNLYFPLENVDIDIWVLKATVRKLLFGSIASKRKENKHQGHLFRQVSISIQLQNR